jgi:hypothetical protein
VQARALAAFARCRPGELLDRPVEEVGAAAVASRAVLKADATAAVARAARAVRERQERLFPGEDGMATLTATFPAPVAAA